MASKVWTVYRVGDREADGRYELQPVATHPTRELALAQARNVDLARERVLVAKPGDAKEHRITYDDKGRLERQVPGPGEPVPPELKAGRAWYEAAFKVGRWPRNDGHSLVAKADKHANPQVAPVNVYFEGPANMTMDDRRKAAVVELAKTHSHRDPEGTHHGDAKSLESVLGKYVEIAIYQKAKGHTALVVGGEGENGGVLISRSVELTAVQKNYGRGGGYSRQLWIGNGKDRDSLREADGIRIQCKKTGELSELSAVARLMDMGEGDRSGRTRSVLVDLGVEAGRTHKLADDSAFLWWIHPNESDIRKIDTPDSELGKRLKALAASADKSLATVVIMGTAAERQKVLTALNENFTRVEKRKMRGLVIEVGSGRLARAGAAGFYRQRVSSAISRTTDPQFYIKVGKDYATPDVITHEIIHHLRNIDETRAGALKATPYWSGKDRDLEEAMTEAETLARYRPFREGGKGQVGPYTGAGYYTHTRKGRERRRTSLAQLVVDQEKGKKLPPTPAEEQAQDRAIMTLLRSEKGKPLTIEQRRAMGTMRHERLAQSGRKGKIATKRVDRFFPETAISTMQIKGRAEAIDSFYELKNAKGQTVTKLHTYSPRAVGMNIKTVRDEIGALDAPGGRVVAWSDGKLVPAARVATPVAKAAKRLVGTPKRGKGLIR